MSDVSGALIGFAGTVLTGGLARFVWNGAKRFRHAIGQSLEQKQFDVSMLALTKVREAQTQQNALLQQDLEAVRETLKQEREAYRSDRAEWETRERQLRQEIGELERQVRDIATQLSALRSRHGFTDEP